MKLPTLTEIAKGHAWFIEYRGGSLWYRLEYSGAGGWTETFEFPVPINDAGDGTFGINMRGVQLLRWARKHVEYLHEAQKKEAETP